MKAQGGPILTFMTMYFMLTRLKFLAFPSVNRDIKSFSAPKINPKPPKQWCDNCRRNTHDTNHKSYCRNKKSSKYVAEVSTSSLGQRMGFFGSLVASLDSPQWSIKQIRFFNNAFSKVHKTEKILQ